MRKPPSSILKRILKVRAAKLERMRYRKNKKNLNNKKKRIEQFRANKPYREQAKYVKDYSDVINIFMPDNLKYLIQHSRSPFCKQ